MPGCFSPPRTPSASPGLAPVRARIASDCSSSPIYAPGASGHRTGPRKICATADKKCARESPTTGVMVGETKSPPSLPNPMNTSHLSSKFAAAASLAALVIGSTGISFAGPGIAAWRQAPTDTAVSSKSAALAPACGGCADMKTVAVSSTTPTWANARGPLQTTTLGSQTTCQTCAAATVAMKPSWPNARGPLQASTTPTAHVCQTVLVAATR